MHERNKSAGMNRRDFIRIGLAGTTSALLGGNALAETVQHYAASESEPFAFPKPDGRRIVNDGAKAGIFKTPELDTVFANYYVST